MVVRLTKQAAFHRLGVCSGAAVKVQHAITAVETHDPRPPSCYRAGAARRASNTQKTRTWVTNSSGTTTVGMK